MAFSSVQFLFIFLPLSLAVYWLLPKALRNGALGAFSLLFFVWAGLKGAAILLALAAITWLGGLLLEKLPRKKPLLILLIATHLAVLAAFKYAGFAARSINALVPDLLPVFAPALPLGISFYVFTAIGYLADVSGGKVAAARSPFRFLVFLAFFGHGPSGPIVRYDQQLPCLDAKAAERQVSLDRFCYGIKRFVLGLAKKAIIADQLALIYSRVTSVPAATVPAPALVLGYLAYMMQLYFDFSGYSDMAIGIGSFFGLELPENFNYPYLSCSVGEYWRRWHMSLSGWFRDYVYIPLGGSRCSLAKNCRNLLIVFLLTGLWHGAAWQYVAFGLLHGVLLCLERLGLRKFLQRIPPFFAHAYTLVVLWFTLIIFGAHGLAEGTCRVEGHPVLAERCAGLHGRRLCRYQADGAAGSFAAAVRPPAGLLPPPEKGSVRQRSPRPAGYGGAAGTAFPLADAGDGGHLQRVHLFPVLKGGADHEKSNQNRLHRRVLRRRRADLSSVQHLFQAALDGQPREPSDDRPAPGAAKPALPTAAQFGQLFCR